MIPPAAAEEARRGLVSWAHHLRDTGTAVPDGYRALVDLIAAYARNAPDPELLTLEEAAEHAGVSLRTLRRWRTDGLPTVHRAGRLLVRRRELDAWPGQLADSFRPSADNDST